VYRGDGEKLKDYWEVGDMVFVCDGFRYGLTENCRTVCLGPAIPVTKPIKPPKAIKLPIQAVTPFEQGEIKRLAGLGMGVRAIARELKLGNHMKIWRVLQKPLITV
jgi:hypothetical protein